MDIKSITNALVSGVPKIVSAIKSGRKVEDIKLGEVISADALEQIDRAISKSSDFENRFK